MFEQIHWPKNRDFQRIFHGRGHTLSGYEHLTIDWIAPVIQITLYQSVEREWLITLVEALKSGFESPGVPELQAIVVQYRDQFGSPREWLWGEAIEQLVTEEQGLKYQIQLGKAQNCGLFPDMATGRAWIRQQSEGKRVLNLFSYTCGFSVAAMAGGAGSVVNVDMAKGPLTTGRENHRLNQHDLCRIRFEAVNLFKSWGRVKRHGPYNLLIADPPSFQKGSIDVRRDYVKIIRRVPELLQPDGLAMLCLNSPSLDSRFLLDKVSEHCPALIFEQRLYPGEHFPEQNPERGLKILVFRYLPALQSRHE